MSIIRPESNVYIILSGHCKGQKCSIPSHEVNRFNQIRVFLNETDSPIFIDKGKLALLSTPGWLETTFNKPYSLKEYTIHKGDGINMLRDNLVAQPRALEKGDVLATGETVFKETRVGFNSSVLVHLDKSGWIELAPRFPIALFGNNNFRLPINLVKGDKLATGEFIFKNPYSSKICWINICFDKSEYEFQIPSCVPLALA